MERRRRASVFFILPLLFLQLFQFNCRFWCNAIRIKIVSQKLPKISLYPFKCAYFSYTWSIMESEFFAQVTTAESNCSNRWWRETEFHSNGPQEVVQKKLQAYAINHWTVTVISTECRIYSHTITVGIRLLGKNRKEEEKSEKSMIALRALENSMWRS